MAFDFNGIADNTVNDNTVYWAAIVYSAIELDEVGCETRIGYKLPLLDYRIVLNVNHFQCETE